MSFRQGVFSHRTSALPAPVVTASATYVFIASGPGRMTLQLQGCWKTSCSIPELDNIFHQLPADLVRLKITAEESLNWDSVLPMFLSKLLQYCRKKKIPVDHSGLPEGVQTLLELAQKTAPQAQKKEKKPGPITRLGQFALQVFTKGGNLAGFVGEIVTALILLLRGRAYFRFRDFFYFLQNCGADALPIVSLISILVGIILAFVGAVQLRMFGAQIYVANLVALSMVLEMGAMMSGIIIAGRTGAAYAAQLGTMQVNEEIDALRTLGISPVSYLVLPRMLALICMLPLLCIYADLLGIAGGSLIGVWMMDISFYEYFAQSRKGLHLWQINQGLIKSSVYGVLISFSGCYQGLNSGRSSSAVGEATTSAVVMSIVLIVISDAIMVVIFSL